MLKIAICDDNSSICSELEKIIIEYGKTSIVKFDIEIFNTGESLIEYIKNEHKFDLIFLDIELGDTTGIQVGSKIRKELEDDISKIVFITSKNGYEQELFDIQPLNFIKKPIDNEKLKNCISLSIKLLELENKTFEYAKKREVIKINIKDILYFESSKKKIKIVTHSGEDWFYETMEKLKGRLPKTFIESHGSYIVNFDKVERANKDFLIMTDGHKIPISQRCLQNVRSMLISYAKEKKNV